jgi:hypothetical protein
MDDRAALVGDRLRCPPSVCTRRQLPPVSGTSWQTAHRRFTDWSRARVWADLPDGQWQLVEPVINLERRQFLAACLVEASWLPGQVTSAVPSAH